MSKDGKNYKLTHNQQVFCQEIAQGATQSDAYRTAYPAQAKSSLDSTIHSKASTLSVDGRVMARIAELKEDALQHVKYGIEQHYNELDEMKVLAMEKKGMYSTPETNVALKAVELKGKLKGLYIDRIKQETTNLSDEELDRRIAQYAELEGLTSEEYKKKEGLM